MIQNNGVMIRQFGAAMQMIQRLAMMNPQIGAMAVQQGLMDPQVLMDMQAQQIAQSEPGTAEERAARNTAGGDNSQAAKARVRAANAASPM